MYATFYSTFLISVTMFAIRLVKFNGFKLIIIHN